MNDYQKGYTLYNHQGNRNSQQKGFSNSASTRTLKGDNLVIQLSQQCPPLYIYLTMCKDTQIPLNHC